MDLKSEFKSVDLICLKSSSLKKKILKNLKILKNYLTLTQILILKKFLKVFLTNNVIKQIDSTIKKYLMI